MNEDRIKEEYQSLKKKILYHNRLYYQQNSPEISDAEYDLLYRRLLQIEQQFPGLVEPDSPSQIVGDKPLSSLKKVEHSQKMLSLDNAFSLEQLHKFRERLEKKFGQQKIHFVLEAKIDGLSVELTYRRGQLYRAATRGDGLIGEDVSENIRTVKGLPQQLAKDLSITLLGEVYIDKKDLLLINQQREKNGEELFKNSRNAAAGSLRLLDSKISAQRPLKIIIYTLVDAGQRFEYHSQSLAWLSSLGFPIDNNYFRSDDFGQLTKEINSWLAKRKKIAFAIDGLVLKLDNLQLQQELGSTAKYPRWAIAYKFPAEQAESKLLKITTQVGRTGVLTPVAELQAVELAGTTVSRASLHNAQEIKRKDIRLGDTVIIEKAGEIIPQVVRVVKERRVGREKKFRMPKKCPVCGSAIVQSAELVARRCPAGSSCPAQLKQSVRHFASRGALNIEQLGPALIDQLIEAGLIKRLSDIFLLEKEALLQLERMAEKSATKLLRAIKLSKEIELSRLIYGLGIPFVGQVAAKLIAEKFLTLQKIVDIEGAELTAQIATIDGIGEKTSLAFGQFFGASKNRRMLKELLKIGMVAKEKIKSEKKKGKLFGLSFCISGKLSRKREEYKKLIEAAGGRFDSSIGNNTDYLIAGLEMGQRKKEAAAKKGVELISEQQFQQLLNEKI